MSKFFDPMSFSIPVSVQSKGAFSVEIECDTNDADYIKETTLYTWSEFWDDYFPLIVIAWQLVTNRRHLEDFTHLVEFYDGEYDLLEMIGAPTGTCDLYVHTVTDITIKYIDGEGIHDFNLDEYISYEMKKEIVRDYLQEYAEDNDVDLSIDDDDDEDDDDEDDEDSDDEDEDEDSDSDGEDEESDSEDDEENAGNLIDKILNELF